MSNQDDFMGGGESLKFEKIGDSHKGVVRSITSRVDVDPAGTPKTWSDGSPKKVFCWELELEDGTIATLWVRGNMVKVLREACAKAGAKSQADIIGGTVSVKHHKVGEPQTKGYQGAKLYQAKFEIGKGFMNEEPDPFADE